MKNVFSIIFLGFLLFSCHTERKKDIDVAKNDKPVETIANPLSAYAGFIKSLDTNDVTSVSLAAKEFSELFTKAATTEADSAFVLFSRTYERIEAHLNDQLLKDPAKYSARVADSTSIPASSATFGAKLRKLKENGFQLASVEGSTYIKQDRTFLSKYFYPHVSSAMKEYLVQVHKENEEGLIDDGGLLITPIDLSNRILWWESFLQRHPSFVFNEEIKQKQKGNTTFLLEGLDNTPLLDLETKQLSNDYQKAFENVLTTHPQSTIAGLVKPYFKALKQKDMKAARRLLQQYKKQGIIYDYSE